jgi:hypothetical protein
MARAIRVEYERSVLAAASDMKPCEMLSPTVKSFMCPFVVVTLTFYTTHPSVASSRQPLACSLGFFRKPRHAKTIEICR